MFHCRRIEQIRVAFQAPCHRSRDPRGTRSAPHSPREERGSCLKSLSFNKNCIFVCSVFSSKIGGGCIRQLIDRNTSSSKLTPRNESWPLNVESSYNAELAKLSVWVPVSHVELNPIVLSVQKDVEPLDDAVVGDLDQYLFAKIPKVFLLDNFILQRISKSTLSL